MKNRTIALLAALSFLSATGVARADDHDWHNGQRWDGHEYHGSVRDNHPPQRVFYYSPQYYQPRPQVVYLQPQEPYNGQVYYSQVFSNTYIPSNSSYSETYYYPNGTVRTYTVGGVLPGDRRWEPVNDYVRFGLRAPRHGERWVRSGHDAVLISNNTSRVLASVILSLN